MRTHRRRQRHPRRWVAAALVAVVALLASACETEPEDFATTFDLINDARVADGLEVLDGQLDIIEEADAWAQHMRDTCTLEHRDDLWEGTPDGTLKVTENVGVVPHVTDDPDDALEWMHDTFMDSDGHRANILDPGVNRVGIGAVPGSCGVTGADAEYWVVHIFIDLP